MKSLLESLFVCALLLSTANAQQLNNVYTAGQDGYTCFRIPAIITSAKGTVLAIAEGRRNNCGDAGDIDLVVKRSSDGGKTWGPLAVIWSDSTNTCGNPTPILDEQTGKIILLSTWNLGTDHEKDIIAGSSKDSRRVFVLSSDDDGVNWSAPKEITESVKEKDWTWYATGPGKGIQLQHGRHKGRLVAPSNHMVAVSKANYSHAIYSDDGGMNWKLGGTTKQDSVNESTLAEISRGRVMLNMRNASKKRFRQISVSKDGGSSWSDIRADNTLTEPVCEGNLLAYRFPGRRSLLLFTNPASQTARTTMTFRISSNNGRSWKESRVLHAGPSAYSSMTVLPNGNVGCFYEAGLAKPYEGIVFQEVKMSK